MLDSSGLRPDWEVAQGLLTRDHNRHAAFSGSLGSNKQKAMSRIDEIGLRAYPAESDPYNKMDHLQMLSGTHLERLKRNSLLTDEVRIDLMSQSPVLIQSKTDEAWLREISAKMAFSQVNKDLERSPNSHISLVARANILEDLKSSSKALKLFADIGFTPSSEIVNYVRIIQEKMPPDIIAPALGLANSVINLDEEEAIRHSTDFLLESDKFNRPYVTNGAVDYVKANEHLEAQALKVREGIKALTASLKYRTDKGNDTDYGLKPQLMPSWASEVDNTTHNPHADFGEDFLI